MSRGAVAPLAPLAPSASYSYAYNNKNGDSFIVYIIIIQQQNK
jgi:hypothetical protein